MSYRNKTNTESRDYLDLMPERILEHEINEKNGLIMVLVPKFRTGILGRFLQPRIRDKYLRADFDKFGSSVWQRINGYSSIRDIANGLTVEFGDEIQPVNQRLTQFFSQLHKAGFIKFKKSERN